MSPTQEHDVVLIGAGHNGLVAGNYLRDAGLDVLVVEASHKIGGMTTTDYAIADAPNHLINSCAVDPIFFDGSPPVSELELHKYGYRTVEVDPPYAYLHPDGSSIAWWRDARKTADEIRYFSPADATAFLKFSEMLDRLFSITYPMTNSNPVRPDLGVLMKVASKALKHRRELVDFAVLGISSGTEIIAEHFRHPVVRSAMHSFTASMYPSTIPGASLYFLILPVFHRFPMRRPIGGTQAIPDALAKRFSAVGGSVMTSAAVREIAVDHENRATGVVLLDGTYIMARHAVIATCDPKTALGRLLPGGTLSSTLEARVNAIPIHHGGYGTIKVDVALSGKLTLSKHNRQRRDGLDLRIPSHHIGNEEGLQRAYGRCSAGLLPDPADFGAWNCIPTAADPSQAPDGQDVLYIYSGTGPAYPEDGWEGLRDKAGQVAIDNAAIFYDGIAELELGRQVLSHEDIARAKRATEGQFMHIDHLLSHMGPFRPARGLGFKTPVDGLFLGGAGCHPGGGVTGSQGYIVAREVLRAVPGSRRRRVLSQLGRVGREGRLLRGCRFGAAPSAHRSHVADRTPPGHEAAGRLSASVPAHQSESEA